MRTLLMPILFVSLAAAGPTAAQHTPPDAHAHHGAPALRATKRFSVARKPSSAWSRTAVASEWPSPRIATGTRAAARPRAPGCARADRGPGIADSCAGDRDVRRVVTPVGGPPRGRATARRAVHQPARHRVRAGAAGRRGGAAPRRGSDDPPAIPRENAGSAHRAAAPRLPRAALGWWGGRALA